MTNSSSDRPGEFQLIAELFAPLATAPGAFGLRDDAAVIAPPAGHELVLKTDAIVEGVHFFPDDPPNTIAKKALRVNLSDLAAKGAVPLGYLLALSIPSRVGMDWLRGFAEGLREDQAAFGISLFGGDTTSTPGPISIAISAFGHLPVGSIVRRSGANPGDLLYVSGTIGDSGGGLACLKNAGGSLSKEHREFLIRRFRVPEPRVALGPALRGISSASLDVSDGLLADLGHIAEVSRVRIVVEAARLPLSPALRALKGAQAAVFAATGGDDYEIAFTAPAECRRQVAELAKQSGTAVTEIGRVEMGEGVVLVDVAGREIPLARKGFTHF
jgi:thiamine-monophosphate kinase